MIQFIYTRYKFAISCLQYRDSNYDFVITSVCKLTVLTSDAAVACNGARDYCNVEDDHLLARSCLLLLSFEIHHLTHVGVMTYKTKLHQRVDNISSGGTSMTFNFVVLR